ncbi:MAG: hypothetical protein ACR2RD_18120 [Woeseiaceae bacterium]
MNVQTTICLYLAALSLSASAATIENWSQTQIDVWSTVQARNVAWKNNDFEAYVNIHHDNWHRYSMRTSKLLSKDDVAVFWDNAKQNEKVIQIELQPIAIDVFGNEMLAIAHYVLIETFEWIGDDFERPV